MLRALMDISRTFIVVITLLWPVYHSLVESIIFGIILNLIIYNPVSIVHLLFIYSFIDSPPPHTLIQDRLEKVMLTGDMNCTCQHVKDLADIIPHAVICVWCP